MPSSASESPLTPEGKALLEWFNFLPTSGSQHTSIDDLSDGSKVWKALRQLDPDFFSDPLPEEVVQVRGSGKWLAAWSNLKHLYKHMADYVKADNGRLPSGPGSVDLEKIAKGGDANETIKLLELLLFVAINARENEAFVEAMTMLSEEKQIMLQTAIIDFQADSQSNDVATSTKVGSVDKDLFLEEQLGRLNEESKRLAQEKKDLQRDLRDLHERNTRLQEHNSSLQDKLTSAEERLDVSANSVGQPFLKEIEGKVQQQEDLIASQETQLADAQRTIDGLRLESNKFRASHDRYQPLQDEFDEMKAERDSLARKANAIDKYKQKLQTMQETEKENNNLRNQLEEYRELNQQGSKALDRVKVLETTIDEYKKVIPTIEQELHEQRMIRKQSDYRSEELNKRLKESNDQFVRDQERIAELIEQLEAGASRIVGEGLLENELIKDASHENELVTKCTLAWTRLTYLARFSDIKAQNQQLMRSNNEHSGRIAMLESMLAVAKQRNLDLEERIDETSRAPSNWVEGFPKCNPGPDLLANSCRSESRNVAEDAELEKERSVFQRTSDDHKGKQYTNFAQVIEEMAENGEIVVINRTELQTLQRNEGAADQLQAKGVENQELQKRIKDLETQVSNHQAMLSSTIGGPAAEETAKLIEAATKAVPETDRQELDAHTSMLLETLMKSQSSLSERTEVTSSPTSRISYMSPAISSPLRSIVRPRSSIHVESPACPSSHTAPCFTLESKEHLAPIKIATSRRSSWLPWKSSANQPTRVAK